MNPLSPRPVFFTQEREAGGRSTLQVPWVAGTHAPEEDELAPRRSEGPGFRQKSRSGAVHLPAEQRHVSLEEIQTGHGLDSGENSRVEAEEVVPYHPASPHCPAGPCAASLSQKEVPGDEGEDHHAPDSHQVVPPEEDLSEVPLSDHCYPIIAAEAAGAQAGEAACPGETPAAQKAGLGSNGYSQAIPFLQGSDDCRV